MNMEKIRVGFIVRISIQRKRAGWVLNIQPGSCLITSSDTGIEEFIHISNEKRISSSLSPEGENWTDVNKPGANSLIKTVWVLFVCFLFLFGSLRKVKSITCNNENGILNMHRLWITPCPFSITNIDWRP